MLRLKKYMLVLFILIISTAFLIGCGDDNPTASSTISSGQSMILTEDAPVCSSKENVDKMISYVQSSNSSGKQEMLQRGEATIISKGTKINVIKTGIIFEIEDESGTKWFAPKEAIK